MGLREKLRALLESADEVDEVEVDDEVADEVEDEVADEVEDEVADEVEDDETPGDEEQVDEGGEGTQTDEVADTPEVADLRAQIIDQAAQIETMRNRLAAAGIEDDIDEDAVEDIDEIDDTVEDDVVEAFDSDYADRQAILDEIKEHHA